MHRIHWMYVSNTTKYMHRSVAFNMWLQYKFITHAQNTINVTHAQNTINVTHAQNTINVTHAQNTIKM